MLENIIVSIAVTLLIGFPLSAYSGIIVARYASFDSILNQARAVILNLEQTWEYRPLKESIPDTASPTGRRTVFMSDGVSSNSITWKLTQHGLALKELGHWKAAQALDGVWLELDHIRESFVDAVQASPSGGEIDLIDYIADWHRTLSSQKPDWWRIFRPYPNARYQHLSSIEVDESTGDWKETEPIRNQTKAEQDGAGNPAKPGA